MRAIASGKLEGFPPKEELRTAYVEHDIDASASEMGIVDFVFTDPNLQGAPCLLYSNATSWPCQYLSL